MYQRRLIDLCSYVICDDKSNHKRQQILAATKYRYRKPISNRADATTVSGDIIAANNISGDF